MHNDEQPSPFRTFPSSQASLPITLILSPHTTGRHIDVILLICRLGMQLVQVLFAPEVHVKQVGSHGEHSRFGISSQKPLGQVFVHVVLYSPYPPEQALQFVKPAAVQSVQAGSHVRHAPEESKYFPSKQPVQFKREPPLQVRHSVLHR